MENITIQVSARIYNGYQYSCPREWIHTEYAETLIGMIKVSMKNFFRKNNLFELAEGVDKLNLHLHLEGITRENVPVVIFACDSKHSN